MSGDITQENWSLDLTGVISAHVVNERGKIITSLPVGAGWWHDNDAKARWLKSVDGQEAQLIAAAPATTRELATLRSRLERVEGALRDVLGHLEYRVAVDPNDYRNSVEWADVQNARAALNQGEQEGGVS